MLRRWSAITLLVVLSACAGPAGTGPLFQDGFDDARNGWTLTSNTQAQVKISGGQLIITVNRLDALAWTIAAGKSFGDFTLSVDATPLARPDDSDYGVIVRHVDDNNFYRFEISGDGYFNIQKRIKGKWDHLIP